MNEGKKTVLLVEDELLIRDMVRIVLEKDHHILEASGYHEAIQTPVDSVALAIIDYILPDGNGFEVLKKLRRQKSELPAIIMTGFSNENVVIRAVRATVADYIKKPLNLVYLRQRVSEIMGGTEMPGDFIEVQKRDDCIMDGIAVYIRENFMQDLNLDKLARLACMSRSKFCKTFRERFGRSFVSYINEIRISVALELLRSSDLRLTEISGHVGYGSFSQFERSFKRQKGTSPREFRKLLKQSPPPPDFSDLPDHF